MSVVQPSDGRTGTEPGSSDRSVRELVARASQQMSDLVRQELRLAAAELKDKGRHAGLGAGLVGGAGVLAFYGGLALVIAAIAAIALVLPVWAAALAIAVGLFLLAGVLGLLGRSQVSRAGPPVPRQAMNSARDDVVQIRGDLKERGRR